MPEIKLRLQVRILSTWWIVNTPKAFRISYEKPYLYHVIAQSLVSTNDYDPQCFYKLEFP